MKQKGRDKHESVPLQSLAPPAFGTQPYPAAACRQFEFGSLNSCIHGEWQNYTQPAHISQAETNLPSVIMG